MSLTQLGFVVKQELLRELVDHAFSKEDLRLRKPRDGMGYALARK